MSNKANQKGTFNVADVTAAEGQILAHRLTRTNGSRGTVSVNWAISPTTGTTGASSGTVSFAAGKTSAQIKIGTVDDYVVNGSRSYKLTLSNPTGGATIGRGVATGTITNNDAYL